MTEQEAQSCLMGQFRESLNTVVELGYGEDACDPVITAMFGQLMRQSVTPDDLKKLPFRHPATRRENGTTHIQLLKQATQLQSFVQRSSQGADKNSKSALVVFPFMTTLGISGGIFLLVYHITRLVPVMFERSGLLVSSG